MKRYQKTIRCSCCNTANVLKARENKNGNITFNVDPSKLKCWNCGERIYLPSDIDYPWQDYRNSEQL